MNQFIYNGVIYNSWKEIKEATGFSGSKIRAKIADKEIIRLTHTGEITYDNNRKETV